MARPAAEGPLLQAILAHYETYKASGEEGLAACDPRLVEKLQGGPRRYGVAAGVKTQIASATDRPNPLHRVRDSRTLVDSDGHLAQSTQTNT